MAAKYPSNRALCLRSIGQAWVEPSVAELRPISNGPCFPARTSFIQVGHLMKSYVEDLGVQLAFEGWPSMVGREFGSWQWRCSKLWVWGVLGLEVSSCGNSCSTQGYRRFLVEPWCESRKQVWQEKKKLAQGPVQYLREVLNQHDLPGVPQC